MKYLVKKQIPSVLGTINADDIIDSDDIKYKWLDFSNSGFFELYVGPKYQFGDEILYNSRRPSKLTIYKVINCSSNTVTVKNDNGEQYTLKITSKIKQPTRFWFINSNGKICSDYEERYGLDKDGLTFKKLIGNYFASAEIAREYLKKALNV